MKSGKVYAYSYNIKNSKIVIIFIYKHFLILLSLYVIFIGPVFPKYPLSIKMGAGFEILEKSRCGL